MVVHWEQPLVLINDISILSTLTLAPSWWALKKNHENHYNVKRYSEISTDVLTCILKYTLSVNGWSLNNFFPFGAAEGDPTMAAIVS